jgi:hypothetical protein
MVLVTYPPKYSVAAVEYEIIAYLKKKYIMIDGAITTPYSHHTVSLKNLVNKIIQVITGIVNIRTSIFLN